MSDDQAIVARVNLAPRCLDCGLIEGHEAECCTARVEAGTMTPRERQIARAERTLPGLPGGPALPVAGPLTYLHDLVRQAAELDRAITEIAVGPDGWSRILRDCAAYEIQASTFPTAPAHYLGIPVVVEADRHDSEALLLGPCRSPYEWVPAAPLFTFGANRPLGVIEGIT